MDVNQAAVRLENVNKTYSQREGSSTPLKGVTLTVPAGSITGCVGPAGAGKTTLLKLLTGLVRPTSGRIEVLGGRPGAVGTLARMGCCLHSLSVPAHLTPREYLLLCCRLLGGGRAEAYETMDRLASLFEMEDLMDRPVAALSASRQQGLNLMQALVGDPDLLLLDEPFAGPGADRLAALLAERPHRGKTVLICTQHAGQLAGLTDRLLRLDGGRAAWKEAAP